MKLIHYVLCLFLVSVCFQSMGAEWKGKPFKLTNPAELWERVQPSLAPFEYKITKDEMINSAFDATMKIRRLEFTFNSQKLFGETVRHSGIILIPQVPRFLNDPARRGKIVIVGSLLGRCKKSFEYNYGQNIATRTGYPTMVLPVPGDSIEQPDSEWSIRPLIEKVNKTHDPIDHHYFRLAIPFLRAVEVAAGVLKVDKKDVRAIIGGHSKRATGAYTAAAIWPDNFAGVVYLGNENIYERRTGTPLEATSPYYTQRFVKCPTLYVGATNEGGYSMFANNTVQSHLNPTWSLATIPNYRHASEAEKQFTAWKLWTSHCFDGRPLTKISELKHKITEKRTEFSAKIDSPNTLLIVYAWYVYCDDEPYWRDLMWYPMTMYPRGDGIYTSRLQGMPPDAWMVEVLDIANGTRGYLTSLPMNITGKKAIRKPAGRGGLPREWKPRPAK
jgi:hypothetical protein